MSVNRTDFADLTDFRTAAHPYLRMPAIGLAFYGGDLLSFEFYNIVSNELVYVKYSHLRCIF
jgi:hypothetical protein